MPQVLRIQAGKIQTFLLFFFSENDNSHQNLKIGLGGAIKRAS
jgi:hypothetical protein